MNFSVCEHGWVCWALCAHLGPLSKTRVPNCPRLCWTELHWEQS